MHKIKIQMLAQQILNSKLFSIARKPLRNQKGVALMIAITCIMMIMWIAMEVSYDSNVEYLVNAQNLNRTKAYYAAKSGVKVSMLRIKIYEKAKAMVGDKLGDTSMLDQIWKFPFAWPLPIPDEMNAVEKGSFQDAIKESLMDASYMVTIEDQGSKIDLTNLGSANKEVVEQAREQILNLFKQRINNDEVFSRKYGQTNFEEIINRMADFQSNSIESLNGGDKRSAFSNLNPSGSDYYPPNRSFRSVAELKLIPGMNEDFYEILEPAVNVGGPKGINPNLASPEVLLGLDPGMTKEIVEEIVKRREDPNEGGPFKCDDKTNTSSDFWNFVQDKGLRAEGDVSKIPLSCDSPMSFKIVSSGEFAGAAREITVVTIQKSALTQKFKDSLKSSQDKQTQSEGNNETNPENPDAASDAGDTNRRQTETTKTEPASKGPPHVIQWSEK